MHKHVEPDKQALELHGKESGKTRYLGFGDILDKTNQPHYTHM
jgi:hypothetical protein